MRQSRPACIEWIEISTLRIAKLIAPKRSVPFALTPPVIRDSLAVLLQLNGTSTCVQQERTVQLVPGQWDAFSLAPLLITPTAAPAEHCALLIPHTHLGQTFDAAVLGARRRPGAPGMSKLLCHIAAVILRELPASHPHRRKRLAHLLRDSLYEAIDERLHGPPPVWSTHEALHRRAVEYINSHLHDPQLSVRRIARAVQRDTSHLQKIFRRMGLTPTQYIRVQRLNRCYMDLIDPALKDRSITELALKWGFESLSHFSAAFRSHYEKTPTEARRG